MAIDGIRCTRLLPHGVPGSVLSTSAPVASWLLPLEFTLQLLGPSTDPFQVPQDYQSCQVLDTGVQLVVEVTDQNGNPVNLKSASATVIRLRLPDGTLVDHAAIFLTDGTDGQVVYTTGPGDLPRAGTCAIQAKVTMSNSTKYTRLGHFNVLENTDDN